MLRFCVRPTPARNQSAHNLTICIQKKMLFNSLVNVLCAYKAVSDSNRNENSYLNSFRPATRGKDAQDARSLEWIFKFCRDSPICRRIVKARTAVLGRLLSVSPHCFTLPIFLLFESFYSLRANFALPDRQDGSTIIVALLNVPQVFGSAGAIDARKNHGAPRRLESL